MERRLAAIMAADMVGYSRLIEADERGTLHRQRTHRAELIDPTIEKFNGRIVKLMGDGLLAEFASVVDAVQCAVAIQRAMVGREEDVADDRRIRYRVGINLGDIVFEDGDIFGHGVNVAARLEAMALPGGVVISGAAYDTLSSNVEVDYEALGDVQVKNIAEPVRAYRVLLDGAGAPVGLRMARTPRKAPFLAAALVCILAASAGALWLGRTDFVPADPAKLAYPLPDKPSIAVLPFEDMTKNEDNQYLADGFVDTLIFELSRLPDLFVISRHASFAFREKEVPVGGVSEALGVRYVVEGSFRRSGEELRIDVKLIDAVEGNLVWSERYDRPAEEFFQLQDELVAGLAKEIGGRNASGIFLAERRRLDSVSNADLSAIELWEKASQAYLKFSVEGNERTAEIAREMISRFPEHPRGYTALGWYHLGRIITGTSSGPVADLGECRKLANRALDLDALDYMGHLLLGYCSAYSGNKSDAVAGLSRAYELNPHDSLVQKEYAKHALVRAGRHDEALGILERLYRLSPGQQVGLNSDMAMVHFGLENYADAVALGEGEPRRSLFDKARLAAAYWMNDQPARSRALVAEILEENEAYRLGNAVSTVSWLPDEARGRYAEALAAAGLSN